MCYHRSADAKWYVIKSAELRDTAILLIMHVPLDDLKVAIDIWI